MPKKSSSRVKRVRLRNGQVRYMKGGKFVKTSTGKAAVKRRRRKTTKSNPAGKKRTVRRKAAPARGHRRKTTRKKTTRRKTTTTRRRVIRRNPTKKRRTTRRTATTTRRKTVARKKTTRRRRVRRNPMSKAARSAKAKRQPRYKSGPNKGKFKPKAGRTGRKGKLSKQTVYLRPGPKSRKLSKYKVRRTGHKGKAGTPFYRYSLVRGNPLGNLKPALMSGLGLFGGVLAMRATTHALKKHVFSKMTDDGALTGAMAILPAGGAFALSLLAPKVVKGRPDLVRSLQMGAAYVLFEAAFKQWVLPALSGSETGKKIAPYLSGDDDFVVYPAMAAYVDDNRYGEYVGDNRYGAESYDVEPALAGDEEAFMEYGGSGGVFSDTVFSGVRGF